MSFSGDEEKLIDSVVSVLDSGREKFTFQEVQLQSEIRYKDIIIDLNHREIIRDNKKIELNLVSDRYSKEPINRDYKPQKENKLLGSLLIVLILIILIIIALLRLK